MQKKAFKAFRTSFPAPPLVAHNERGMALLITIMTLSLLTAVTIQFHKETWHKLIVSDNFKRGVQLKSITDSGLSIALAALQNDLGENASDSLLDSWALLDQENLDLLFPAGGLQLIVRDLSGRLQINSIVEQKKSGSKAKNSGTSDDLRTILFNVLMSEDFPVDDETEAGEMVDALVDWIDEDDNESDHGAETSYYQSLDEPYSARNGPVHNIEELLLVRGITPELFFGTGVTKGLKDILTAYGDDGKININTIEPVILMGMNPLITESLAEQFDEYRKDKDNIDSLQDSGWYKNIGWPGDIELNTELLTTESRYFQITAKGSFDTLSWTMIADAERNGDGELTLLRKKVE
ncbi:MAG: general secretion pathway protein K [Desulforhopalus sp.]|jgi:general secretion pathway protein K